MKPNQGNKQSKCPNLASTKQQKALTMLLEWYEDKRQQNITKHGVDFHYAALIFEGPTLSKIDDRHDYGEERFISELG